MKDIKAKAKAADAKRNARHSDVKEDRAMIKGMVKPSALTGKAKGGAAKAKSKGKGKTQVNVVVAPSSGGASSGRMGGATMPASTAPMMAMGPRKKGGRVAKANGGGVKHVISDGAGGGKGRLEKIDAYGVK